MLSLKRVLFPSSSSESSIIDTAGLDNEKKSNKDHPTMMTKNKKKRNRETTTNNKETIVFFSTSHPESHLKAVHQKVIQLKRDFPHLNFVAINCAGLSANAAKSEQSVGTSILIALCCFMHFLSQNFGTKY